LFIAFCQPTNIHTKISLLWIKPSYRGPLLCHGYKYIVHHLWSRLHHPFLMPKNIYETGKSTCYLTTPTHVSPVICVVHMVTRSTNRSLGPLAGTTMNPKNSTYEYSCIPAPSSIILLLGYPSTYKFYKNVNQTHG
jgi:hypothetical protein